MLPTTAHADAVMVGRASSSAVDGDAYRLGNDAHSQSLGYEVEWNGRFFSLRPGRPIRAGIRSPWSSAKHAFATRGPRFRDRVSRAGTTSSSAPVAVSDAVPITSERLIIGIQVSSKMRIFPLVSSASGTAHRRATAMNVTAMIMSSDAAHLPTCGPCQAISRLL